MTTLKPRKTIYKGIEMRSRLEAGFAQWLDRWDVEWEYEPCAYAADDGQYLPDFVVTGIDVPKRPGSNVYIEIKPPTDAWTLEQIYQRMGLIKQSDPTAVLVLQVPHRPPLVRCVTPVDWVPCDWCYASNGDDENRLGLTQVVTVPEDLPWPDGYWEGRG